MYPQAFRSISLLCSSLVSVAFPFCFHLRLVTLPFRFRSLLLYSDPSNNHWLRYIIVSFHRSNISRPRQSPGGHLRSVGDGQQGCPENPGAALGTSGRTGAGTGNHQRHETGAHRATKTVAQHSRAPRRGQKGCSLAEPA